MHWFKIKTLIIISRNYLGSIFFIKYFRYHLLLTLLAIPLSLNAEPFTKASAKEYLIFQKLFNDWTESFNQKNLVKTCELFSENMIADYQGIPQKNYTTICSGFKKIFSEKEHRYHYRFKIHQVYQSGNLAAVRITWYLDIYKNGKRSSHTQDEGIDILEKNMQGKWHIINYLAYPVD